MKHNTYWFNRPEPKKNSLGIKMSSSFLFEQEKLRNIIKSMTLSSIELAKITNKVVNKHPYVYAVANSDSSYTDGKQIVVGMAPSSNKENVFEGMDIEYGLACHEACHCAYTDFRFCERSFKGISDLCKWIHNVYEDECIEEMMGYAIPNYMTFLDAVRSHYFNVDKFQTPKDDIDIIQVMFLSYVRSKEWVNLIPKEWQDTYGELMDNIYNVVDKYFLIKTNEIEYSPTRQTYDAAVETEKLIIKFLKNKTGKTPNTSLNNFQRQNGMVGQSTSETTTPKQLKQKITQAISSAKSSMERESEYKALEKEGKSIEDIELEEANKNDEIKDMDLKKGSNIKLSFENMKDALIKSKYQAMVTKHKKEIVLAKRMIFHNDKKIEMQLEEFHRNGNLNSRQLAEAIQGINTVYKQMSQKMIDKTNPRYNLVLLIDESGSMRDIANVATCISIILYEAMKDFNGIDLYVYGHGEKINCYVNPKTKYPYSLANRDYQGGQNDALAIKSVIDKVRSQSNKPIFLINVTDSCYLSLDEKMQDAFKYAKEHKTTMGNIMIHGGRAYHNALEIATKTNDEVYGKGNWIGMNKSDSLITVIKNFSEIVEKRYKLLK